MIWNLVLACVTAAFLGATAVAQTEDTAPAATAGEPAATTDTPTADDTTGEAAAESEAEAPTAAAGERQEIRPEDREKGLEIWGRIHQVLSHPRCANCHVPDDRPRWSGPSYGEPRVHAMNIVAGESRIGAETLPCATCHGPRNSDRPHGPPGAAVWHLPPVEQAWFGRTSAEICAQIKDPERNGGRTLAEIAEHIAEDELVHWGWSPGPGREPAPFSADALAAFVTGWAGFGAPCP